MNEEKKASGNTFRLEEPPLFHVLALIEFNPIEEMAELMTALAPALRPLGFLDINKATVQNFHIDLNTQEVSVEPTETWYFVHKDQAKVVNITKTILAFQVNSYSEFDSFQREFFLVVDAVKSTIMGIQETRRLGLRYINLIALDPGKGGAGAWIAPELIGSSLSVSFGTPISSRIERHYSIGLEHVVVVRYSDVPGQPIIPEGINPMGLKVPGSVLAIHQQKSRFIQLDLDAVHHGRKNFEIETLKSVLTKSNDALTDAFRASTTAEAHQKWRIVDGSV